VIAGHGSGWRDLENCKNLPIKHIIEAAKMQRPASQIAAAGAALTQKLCPQVTTQTGKRIQVLLGYSSGSSAGVSLDLPISNTFDLPLTPNSDEIRGRVIGKSVDFEASEQHRFSTKVTGFQVYSDGFTPPSLLI
jgi:hypothetical protein